MGSCSCVWPRAPTSGDLRVVAGDAIEERDRLRREQRDLLLLHEHGELRVLGARLDVERALARFADRAGAETIDVVELDDLAHHASSSSFFAASAPSTPACSGSRGTSSSSDPVSLHFTIAAPWAESWNTVTDAGDTTMRWKWSRCVPVVVRDRRLDGVGVRHDDDDLAGVVGDDALERGDHAHLHLGERLAVGKARP